MLSVHATSGAGIQGLYAPLLKACTEDTLASCICILSWLHRIRDPGVPALRAGKEMIFAQAEVQWPQVKLNLTSAFRTPCAEGLVLRPPA